MALLTTADVQAFWRQAYKQNAAKADFKLSTRLPSPTEILAMLQVLEDFWEDNKATVKADLDTAAGFTLNNATAKAFGKYWLLNKFDRGG